MSNTPWDSLQEPALARRPFALAVTCAVSVLISLRWIAVLLLVYGPAILHPRGNVDPVFLNLDMHPSTLNFIVALLHACLLAGGAVTYWKLDSRGIFIFILDGVLAGLWTFSPAAPPLLNFSGIGIALLAVGVGFYTLPSSTTD